MATEMRHNHTKKLNLHIRNNMTRYWYEGKMPKIKKSPVRDDNLLGGEEDVSVDYPIKNNVNKP